MFLRICVKLSYQERNNRSTVGDTDVELLKSMTPLDGCVEWSTWGSKLESIFSPVFATLPALQVHLLLRWMLVDILFFWALSQLEILLFS